MDTPSVVVVGAGQAGSDTAAALRARGFTGRVILVGDEDTLPYPRPPLSKARLSETPEAEPPPLRPASFYAEQGIELVTGDRAVEIDRDGRLLHLASGRRLPYDRLVLATGARPRLLPVPGAGLGGVLSLRRLADAREVRRRLAGCRHLVVIGGGFLGLEVAAAARARGVSTTVVEAAPRVMARAVSVPMSRHLTAEHRAHGTRVLPGREVAALHGDGAGRVAVVELDRGERIPADLVVSCVGVLPETSLAADAGLAVGDGVLVGGRLRTSDPAILAIGDCARFPSPYGGRPLRLESVQNASGQAAYVAASLCGAAGAPYTAVPWFWTEQHGVRLQIAGITEGHDRTVVAGDPASGRFSVFCFSGARLLGAESVNRPADHMITRRLLAGDGSPPTPEDVARPDFDLRRHRLRTQPA